MNSISILLAIGAFAVSALINKSLVRYMNRRNIMDVPNERSSHSIPTPRGGGLGIVVATVLFSFLYAIVMREPRLMVIVGASLAIGVLGLVDDLKKGIGTGLRLGIQILCAALIVFFFNAIDLLPLPKPLNIHLGYFGYLVAIVWLVGITNIFNFLDGINGYAGTQGFIAGLMLAILAWGTGISALGLIVALACGGFLIFNWHPAKIFMGDVGSSFLGFLFAAIPFYLPDGVGLPFRTDMFFAVAILIWFFLADGVFTIFRRLLKKEKIWQAHRSHLYQRLVITGMEHSQVVLTVCFFYIVLFALTLFYAVQPGHNIVRWQVLGLAAMLFLVYLAYTMYRERQAKSAAKKQAKKFFS